MFLGAEVTEFDAEFEVIPPRMLRLLFSAFQKMNVRGVSSVPPRSRSCQELLP